MAREANNEHSESQNEIHRFSKNLRANKASFPSLQVWLNQSEIIISARKETVRMIISFWNIIKRAVGKGSSGEVGKQKLFV